MDVAHFCVRTGLAESGGGGVEGAWTGLIVDILRPKIVNFLQFAIIILKVKQCVVPRRVMCPKAAGPMASSADPDQMAPEGAV